ncbi:MAG: iron-containing alcohol dehydrogenase [Clostridiales bacterium]|nr:iron-containing alcohol dehydrogenase [Clostridiales bacterium]
MLNFTLYSPTRYEFGRGVETKAGEIIASLGGRRVLVVYGGGSAIRTGVMDRVLQSLTEARLDHQLLGGAQPNPRSGMVYDGVALAREMVADFVLAVGGGSAIDTAKAIALGARYAGDFWDLFAGTAKPSAALPVGVVLTMAAAGSEGSASAVITREADNLKRGLGTEFNRPRFALLNPELTFTVSPYQTACGVTDIMAHVIERYLTNEREVDLTDRLCEAVLQAVIKAAPAAIERPDDYDARSQIMWAGTLAHNDWVGSGRQGDWSSHQIEHELSALYDVPHGAGLAVVLPAFMRCQLSHDVMRFAQFAVRVWGCQMDFERPERTAIEGVERFEQFLRGIGMPITLKELGAKSEDIPALAGKVRRTNGDKVGFFSPLDDAGVEAVLRAADR